MKKILLVVAMIMMLVGSGDAATVTMCTRSPNRMINGMRVNLAPLQIWWTNVIRLQVIAERTYRKNDPDVVHLKELLQQRPMSAWVRVRGTKTLDRGTGWVVTGVVEDIPGSSKKTQFFLKHPPVTDEKMVLALVREQADLGKQRSRAYHVSQSAHYAASAASSERHLVDTVRSGSYAASRNLAGESEQLSGQVRAALSRGENANQVIERCERRLREIDAELAKHPPARPNYEIDYFALRTGELFQGMPVFEMGMRIGS